MVRFRNDDKKYNLLKCMLNDFFTEINDNIGYGENKGLHSEYRSINVLMFCC